MANKYNYKAKYLQALAGANETPATLRSAAEKVAASVVGTNTNTNVELIRVQDALVETAHAAKSLCALMDETRQVGTIDFGELVHGIDSKLNQMSLHVIARRTRDVLKLAEARIGVLTEMCLDQQSALSKLYDSVKSVDQQTSGLQRTLLQTLYIGSNPTPTEYDDFMTSRDPAEYKRFDLEYEGIDDGSDGYPIMPRVLSRHKHQDSGVSMNRDREKDESDSDDSDNEIETALTLVQTNSSVVKRGNRSFEVQM